MQCSCLLLIVPGFIPSECQRKVYRGHGSLSQQPQRSTGEPWGEACHRRQITDLSGVGSRYRLPQSRQQHLNHALLQTRQQGIIEVLFFWGLAISVQCLDRHPNATPCLKTVCHFWVCHTPFLLNLSVLSAPLALSSWSSSYFSLQTPCTEGTPSKSSTSSTTSFTSFIDPRLLPITPPTSPVGPSCSSREYVLHLS